MHKDLCPYTCITVRQINHPLAALSPLQMKYHNRLKDRQDNVKNKRAHFPIGNVLAKFNLKL